MPYVCLNKQSGCALTPLVRPDPRAERWDYGALWEVGSWSPVCSWLSQTPALTVFLPFLLCDLILWEARTFHMASTLIVGDNLKKIFDALSATHFLTILEC